MSSCRRARRRQLERLDGTLGLEAEFRLERHLESCERCAKFARGSAELEEALARLPEPPTEHLDIERSLRAIHERTSSAAPTASRRGRRVALATVAALVLVAATSSFQWLWIGAEEAPELAQEDRVSLEPSFAIATEDPDSISAEKSPITEEPLDRERLERVRAELREILASLALDHDLFGGRGEAERLAAELDERTRTLRLRGWPIGRLVNGLLLDPDPELAGAAARYLGVHPEATSGSALVRALQRPELGSICVCALADLELAGLDGLGRALSIPELREEALAAVVSVGGEEAAALLADGLRAAESSEPTSTSLWLASLADLGLPAVDALLELAEEERIDTGAFRFAVERIPEAGAEFARRLRDLPRGPSAELVMRSATWLAPEASVSGLEQVAPTRALRATAVECLGSIHSPEALLALVRLRDSGRIPPELLDPALRASVDRNADRIEGFVADARKREDVVELEALLELIVANEAAGAARVLVDLAAIPLLDNDQRQAALLALVEIGGEASAEELLALYRGFDERDRRLAAACLVALFELGGEAEVRVALTYSSARRTSTVLELLARPRTRPGSPVSISKLARELAPSLGRAPRAVGDASL